MTGEARRIVHKTPAHARDASAREESEFPTFENPRGESVDFHVANHWDDLLIASVGERTDETRDVVLSCTRCEVRYLLEGLPSERIPGTEAFENLSS